MQAIVAALAAAIFLVAAVGDIRTRRIPNGLVLAIGALAIVRLALAGDLEAAAMTLLCAAAVLAIGFLLFWRGFIGGGDAKLLASATLLIGYHDLFGFLFLMSLCGGALALAVLAQHRLRPWLDALVLMLASRQRSRASAAFEVSGPPVQLSVPYGVAIAAAGIIILGLQTLPPATFPLN